MRNPKNMADDNQKLLDEILTRSPTLAVLAERVRAFATITCELRGERLEHWMTAVATDDLPALHSFVIGLRRDQGAVTAGLTLPWSSGPVEGHVNFYNAQPTNIRQSQLHPAAQENPARRVITDNHPSQSLITKLWTEPLIGPTRPHSLRTRTTQLKVGEINSMVSWPLTRSQSSGEFNRGVGRCRSAFVLDGGSR
jgi:hypothetical protein